MQSTRGCPAVPAAHMFRRACNHPVQSRQLTPTQSEVLRLSQALPPWHPQSCRLPGFSGSKSMLYTTWVLQLCLDEPWVLLGAVQLNRTEPKNLRCNQIQLQHPDYVQHGL